MLSLQFHFCYDVISLQLQVGPIIIWLVVGGVACLEDKWGDAVGSEKIYESIIEVAVMDVKKDYLGVDLAISTGPAEETDMKYTLMIRPHIFSYPTISPYLSSRQATPPTTSQMIIGPTSS